MMADEILTGAGGRDSLSINPGGENSISESYLVEAGSSDAVMLPEGFNFGNAKFEPSGPDLVLTSPDGKQVVIQDYYEQDPAPDLHTPEGTELAGSTVVRLAQVNAPSQGQVAQAAPSADAQPIGQIESVSGTVTAIRADGTRVELQVGDPVFQGDVMESGENGAVGVVLADETTFSMAENGRMVLDEMVYDPGTQEGSISMSVLQGVFTFVSGQVAKVDPDAMVLKTPVATIGIRGTQVGIDLSGDDPAGMKVVLMEEADGFVGEVVLSNNAGIQILNLADQGVTVASANIAPSQPRLYDRSEISDSFRGALDFLPTEVGTGNNYSTEDSNQNQQDDDEQQGKEDSAQDDDEVAEFETASGGDENTEEEFADGGDEAGEEEFAEEDGIAQGTDEGNEDLDDFETAASGEEEDGQGDTGGNQGSQGDQVVFGGNEEGGLNLGGSRGPGIGQEEQGGGGEDGGGGNTPPPPPTVETFVAPDPNAAPEAGNVTGGLTEDGTFAGQVNATDADGDALTFTLSGDGVENGALEFNADGSFTYTPDGDYAGADSFTYTVTDSSGASDTATVNLAVAVGGDVVVAVTDSTADEGDVISLGLSASSFTITDVDGSEIVEAITLDFSDLPDGAVVNGATANADGTYSVAAAADLASVSITPPSSDWNGNFSVELTVTSNEGSASQSFNVTVANVNDAPVISTSPVFAMDEDGVITISETDLLVGATDVDGDDLSVNSVELTSGEGVLTGPVEGVYSFTPNADWNGEVDLAYNVSDGTENVSQTSTITVKPVNDDPVATANLAGTMNEDGSFDGAVSASDIDNVQSELSFSVAAGNGPANGTLEFNADGSYTYTPTGDYAGADSFTYTVEDGAGGTATAVVNLTVTPTGDVEVAVAGDTITATSHAASADDADSVEGDDTVIDLGLSANITDVDGSEDYQSIEVAFTDLPAGTAVNGGTLTAGVWSGTEAELESLTITVPGTFSGDFSGVLTATTDESGAASKTFTVTIDPTNENPVAVNDTGTIDEDGTVAINVLANDSDGDSDTLTVTGASLAVGVAGAVTVNADGTVSFTPGETYNSMQAGTSQDVEITYSIDDGHGGTATAVATVTVTGSNDAASITGVKAGGVAEDTALQVSGDLNVLDPDSNESIFSAVAETAGDHGSFAMDADGNWTYNLDNSDPDVQALGAGDVMTETFTVTSIDGTASETVVITINGTNDAPSVSGVAAAGTLEDDGVAFNIFADITVSDVDSGDSHEISGYSQPANGSVTVSADGGVVFTPDTDPVTGASVFNNMGVGDIKTETFSYTVDDGNGGTSVETATITITGTNDAPVVSLPIQDDTISEDQAYSYDATANFSDIDNGDSLTYSATLEGGAALPDWISIDPETGVISGIPENDDLGALNINVVATDESGWTANDTYQLDILNTNDGPVALNDFGSVDEDAALTLDVLANDSDVDGDALTVTDVSLPDGVDGIVEIVNVNVDGEIVTQVKFTPGDSYNSLAVGESAAPVAITYSISDGQGGTATATATITVTGSNDGFVVAGDAADAMLEDDVSATFNVFDDIAVTDQDTSDSHTITEFTMPENGTVDVLTDGSVTYTPPAGFFNHLPAGETAVETFTYTVDDGNGATSVETATITITGTNDVPDITGVASGAVTEDTTLDVTGTLDILDPDTGESLFVAASADGDHGSFAMDAEGSWSYNLDNTDAAVQALDVGDSITESFAVTSLDGTATETVTITIHGTNDGPVANADVASTGEDVSVTLTANDLLANDTDVDGDALSIVSVQQPENGTVTLNDDGTVTFTPVANYNGPASFTYTITDGDETSTATVNLTVNPENDVPVAVNDVASTDEDSAVTINVLANDSDNDGNALTVTGAVIATGIDATVTVNDDGTLTFTPGASYNALANGESEEVVVTYTISDGQGGTDTATATVTINGSNDGPVAVADDAVITEDVSFVGQLGGSDVDGDSLSFTLAEDGGPEHGSVEIAADGSYTYVPDQDYSGTDSFSFQVSDGQGGTDTATITLSVDAVADNPVVVVSDETGAEDQWTQLHLSAAESDIDGSETLSVLISDVPDGAILNPGTNLGGGEWTVSPEELHLVCILPPAGFVGDIDLNLAVTSTEPNGDLATVEKEFTVVVENVNEGPVVGAAPEFTLNEDGTITISEAELLVGSSDGDGDSLSVTDLVVNDGTGTLTGPDADGNYSYTPVADFSGEVSLNYNVSDGQESVAQTADVTVVAVADAPTLSVEVTAIETTPDAGNDFPEMDHDISNLVLYIEQDGEIIKAKIDNFSDGNSDVRDADDLALDEFMAENYPDASLVAVAVKAGRNTPDGAARGEGELFVLDDSYDAADLPTGDRVPRGNTFEYKDDLEGLTSGAGGGTVTNEYAVNIATALTDTDGSESLSITVAVTGLPDGTTLSAGTPNADGSWSLTAEQLVDLTMTVPDGTQDFDLTVVSTSTEASNGASASTTSTVSIEVPDSTANDHDAQGNDGDDILVGSNADNDDDSDSDADADAGGSDDVLYGGSGADYIDGGAGGDIIYGGSGDDIIIGGEGNDQLYGGSGDDVFEFSLGDGDDTVFDFNNGDALNFEGIDLNEGDSIEFAATGDDVVVTVIGGDKETKVTLKDAAKDLDEDDRQNVGDGYSVSDTGDGSVNIVVDTAGG